MRRSTEWLLLCLFALFLVFNRLQVYWQVNLLLVDSDQPFMWIGAADYAKGLFYEPRFYGQDYNTFLESLFALPYLYAGLPAYKALPLATHTLFLIPFLFTAFYLAFKKSPGHGMLVLAVPLCLPAGYDVLTGIPRGFITGIFFTAFMLPALHQPHKTWWWTLSVALAVLAYFVNANAVVVAAPLLLYLWLLNYRELKFYLYSALGLLTVIPGYFLLDYFYVKHPDYVVYNLVNEFGLKYFRENLQHLDEDFVHLSFFVEHQSVMLLLVLVGLGLYFYRVHRRIVYVLLGLLLLLLATFFASKVREGSNWPFYSYSRMYLGIPLLLGMMMYWVAPLKKVYLWLLVLVVCGFTVFKALGFKTKIAEYADRKHWVGVHLESVDSALELMRFYKSHCKTQHCDTLIIANRFWMNTFINYGGPAVDPDFPTTLETNSERRYKVREALLPRVIPRFVYVSACFDFDQRLPEVKGFKIRRLDDYGLHFVEDNHLTMAEFCKLVNPIEERD